MVRCTLQAWPQEGGDPVRMAVWCHGLKHHLNDDLVISTNRKDSMCLCLRTTGEVAFRVVTDFSSLHSSFVLITVEQASRLALMTNAKVMLSMEDHVPSSTAATSDSGDALVREGSDRLTSTTNLKPGEDAVKSLEEAEKAVPTASSDSRKVETEGSSPPPARPTVEANFEPRSSAPVSDTCDGFDRNAHSSRTMFADRSSSKTNLGLLDDDEGVVQQQARKNGIELREEAAQVMPDDSAIEVVAQDSQGEHVAQIPQKRPYDKATIKDDASRQVTTKNDSNDGKMLVDNGSSSDSPTAETTKSTPKRPKTTDTQSIPEDQSLESTPASLAPAKRDNKSSKAADPLMNFRDEETLSDDSTSLTMVSANQYKGKSSDKHAPRRSYVGVLTGAERDQHPLGEEEEVHTSDDDNTTLASLHTSGYNKKPHSHSLKGLNEDSPGARSVRGPSVAGVLAGHKVDLRKNARRSPPDLHARQWERTDAYDPHSFDSCSEDDETTHARKMDDDDASKSQRTGIWGSVGGWISKKFSSSPGPPKKLELYSVSSWLSRNGPQEYQRTIQMFEKAVQSTDTTKIQRIVDNTKYFLTEAGCSMPYLTFAAHVANTKSNVDTTVLRPLIMKRLSGMNLSLSDVELHKVRWSGRKEAKPNVVWYNFFCDVFALKTFPCSNAEDTLLLKIFQVWDECGLFRRIKYNSAAWQGIREIVDADFHHRNSSQLIKKFGKSKATTLGLLLQHHFDEAVQFVAQVKKEEKNGFVRLDHHASDFVAELIEQAMAFHAPMPTHSLSSFWNELFTLLEQVRFPSVVLKREVIDCAVQAVSYRSLQTFDRYAEVVPAVGFDHMDADILKQCLQENLCEDLSRSQRNAHPKTGEVSLLLASPAGHLLSEGRGLRALRIFAQDAMKEFIPLEDKLHFLGGLYEKFVGHGWAPDISKFEMHIRGLIEVASIHDRDGALSVMRASFNIASECPSIFRRDGPGNAGLVLIANELCSTSGCRDLLDQPSVLTDLPLPTAGSSDDTLHACLKRRLYDMLKSECRDIADASRLFLASASPEIPPGPPLASLIAHVFVGVFSKCNVDRIADFTTMPPVSLELMGKCFDVAAQPHALPVADRQKMVACLDRVKSMATQWSKLFEKEALTKKAIAEACLIEWSAESLEVLSKMTRVCLPSTKDMRDKLSDFQSLEDSIMQLLIEGNEETVPFQKIMTGYNCTSEPGTSLHRLLTEYDSLRTTEHLKADAFSAEAKELRHLREDVSRGLAFRDENLEYLLICDYFLKRPSMLFRSELLQNSDEKLTLSSLVSAVERTKQALVGLVSPASNYADIDNAVKTIKAGQGSIDHELEVLLECSHFGLSRDVVDTFLVVASLSELSGPLKQFVECCRQFKFAVITADPSYANLSSIVRDTFDPSSPPFLLQEGEEHSKRISAMLGGTNLLNYDCIEIRKNLRKQLPILELMGYFSLHSEVWSFAREMGWFGQAGLRRFYEEYANVTNVLLGSTASFEMSVLDAMEPTVRVVSAVGGLHGETTMMELLKKLQDDKDVRAFVGSNSGRADIMQVQTNISLIRDWFTIGVDEIAAVHGKFNAVCATGEYCLLTHDEMGIESALCLRYKAKEEDDGESCLQTDILADFIQQIGLIQHEDESAAAVVNEFVEQYQILARAADNIICTRSVGFPDACKESFRCKVGGEHIEDARELLRDSEAALGKGRSWLASTRSSHLVSLLFWMEELIEIHKAVQDSKGTMEVVTAHNLTCTLSRLSSGLLPYEELSAITQSAVVSWKEAHQQSWLVDVSMFLDSLHAAFGSPWTRPLEDGRSSEIVLHTIVCQRDSQLSVSLRVLEHIYKDRLPEDFEVLDGLMTCTSDRLSLFLERVKAFRSNTFVVLNVEMLEGKLLEKLLSFLCDPTIASEGIRLHLIQKEGTVLHTAPWIDGAKWESDDTNDDVEYESPWKALILDQTHLENLSIVWSPTSGAGKTHHIQKELRNVSLNDKHAKVAKITVHERSSVASLTRDLSAKFSDSVGKRAVHFSFSYAPSLEEAPHWVEAINLFFFSLLILRSVRCPESGESFYLGESNWNIYIELPNHEVGSTSDSVTEWLHQTLPLLKICATFQSPTSCFAIDDDARRVATYLRAYDDGTINRKFETAAHRRILLVLDKSSSMDASLGGRSALSVATDNALGIFDSHIGIGDMFGVIMFDNRVMEQIPTQTIVDEAHRSRLREGLNAARYHTGGGTAMYAALRHAFAPLSQVDDQVETWIVCLTDGASGDTDDLVRPFLEQSRNNVHLIIVGVNLYHEYESYMQLLCRKYQHEMDPNNKGFFVRSEASIASMNSAFDAVSQRIPVSKTFELDGVLTDDECRRLFRKHAPASVDQNDMLLMSFWVRFIFRRVKVFDENDSFNYNETHETLGSTLMKTMLEEVQRLISSNQSRDWIGTDHTQLIYDFTRRDAPEFRLVCTAPDDMDECTRRNLEDLDLPGFSIPTANELKLRSTLDRFLSQALNLSLEGERLKCVDENNFILTLDFTMKLLSIHERVACRTPCIIEGETGVSKTALTRMYAILRNSAVKAEAARFNHDCLCEMAQTMMNQGHALPSGSTPQERLQHGLTAASESVIGNKTDFARDLHAIILDHCTRRASLFQDLPAEYLCDSEARTTIVASCLNWFCESFIEPMFFDINMDSSLTEQDIISSFDPVRKVARKVLETEAIIVVFLDEFNTSSIMGFCKDIIVDRTLAGEALEENIVIVAACNPARPQVTNLANMRERDLGREWASGHYQVASLPPSISRIKWSFGSLNRGQEKEFIRRRIENIEGNSLPLFLQAALTELISESQEAMRLFATRNIKDSLARAHTETLDQNAVDDLALERARSVVSLRDIQRVFALFDFFLSSLKISCIAKLPHEQAQKRSMLLAIGTVYFLRLDGTSRTKFLKLTRVLESGRNHDDLVSVLNEAMDELICETEIPEGIAITRGLKENVFMTFVCTLSRTPLMIVGPPGSSKTLSVNTVADNSNGEDSPSPFYREHARLSLFHYQCSKQSTSKELLAVFDKALQRQSRLDATKHRCFVLMDEAGLPEEEKESLKVLHYLLEGHMSAKSEVGFVAITNHVLDAAKSNRCVILLREEPDEEELACISRGVLFGQRNGHSQTHSVHFSGEFLGEDDFAMRLCLSYVSMLRDNDGMSWFETFFGLRDFIHFLKTIRSRSTVETMKILISVEDIVYAVERNFSGVTLANLLLIMECFVRPLVESRVRWSRSLLEGAFRDPVETIRDALRRTSTSSDLASRARFKLIIDGTEDDSILRLLSAGGVVDVGRRSLHKLSHMQEEVSLEELRLISGVKFAALQGRLAVLSETESVNESFYDLFNQRFQEVTGRDGQLSFYANIAIGGRTIRSLVRPAFECVVHVKESRMQQMPAPFLNRFEKFRLTVSDVLHFGWDSLSGNLSSVFKSSRRSTAQVISALGEHGLFGWEIENQTLDSVYVDMLHLSKNELIKNGGGGGKLPLLTSDASPDTSKLSAFSDLIIGFVSEVSNLRPTEGDLLLVLETAQKYLRVNDAETLRRMLEDGVDEKSVRASMQSLLSPVDTTQLSQICQIIMQMLVTRMAVRRLMQIATPESVFAARELIPDDVLDEYFAQDHFSLKTLVGSLVKKAHATKRSNLTVVYTRSDACVHSIPTCAANKSATLEHPSVIERLRCIVHSEVDELIVEHLSVLKSEAMLRSAVECWTKSSRNKILLLIVDMSSKSSFERINYARMFVEQSVRGTEGKSFILLLHYSPSNTKSCYPALFLGGWEHFFLDGVGNHAQPLGVERLIETACKFGRAGDSPGSSEREKSLSSICKFVEAVLPRVIPHVSSQNIFYAGQGQNLGASFIDRTNMLSMVMNSTVGSTKLASIVCSKFAKMWADNALLKTMERATAGLLLGTTQLSLTMSIHSVLVETFDTFLSTELVTMNQWRNLDIILRKAPDSINKLFGIVLKDLPVMPFEELILQKSNQAMPLLPLDAGNESTDVRFPFFRLVSSCIEECIEKVERDISASSAFVSSSEVQQLGEEILLGTMTTLQELVNCDENGEGSQFVRGRAKPVLAAIDFVQNECDTGCQTLFDRYLLQFIEWTIRCRTQPIIVDWLRTEINQYSQDRNIVAIHIAARQKSKELRSLSSIAITSERYLSGPLPGTEADARNALSASTGEELFQQLLEFFESNLFTDKMTELQWGWFFSMYLHQISGMLSGKFIGSEESACRLRALCFFHILIEASATRKVNPDIGKLWRDRKGRPELSLESFFRALGDTEGESGELSRELAFRLFFSQRWTRITQLFKEEDFAFLLKHIAGGGLVGPHHRLAVMLLRQGCYDGRCEDEKVLFADIGKECTSNAFVLLNSKLSCTQAAVFSEDGKRSCIPHFVPEWLRRESSMPLQASGGSSHSAFTLFLSNYEHCFDCHLSSVVFDMVLQFLLREAQDISSENLFLHLMEGIHTETSIERLDQTRLSRSRQMGNDMSLEGTPLSAIVLDARLICFVTKVAYEMAVDSKATVFEGAYSLEASSLFDGLMNMESNFRWQEFFLSTILRVSGEGALAVALGGNGQLNRFEWCRPWIDGMSSHVDEAARALKEAEDALAEAEEEENRKSQEMRLCPTCSQPFMIDQVNCGAFVCGRDFHGNQGQQGFGCGQTFQVATAGYYTPDDRLLGTLRTRVTEEQSKFREREQAASRWDSARSMPIPTLQFQIERESTNRSLFPCCSFLSATSDSERQTFTVALIEVLLEGSSKVAQYELLSDLIEFYMWLHETFRYLVTREEAFQIKMSEVMKKELLRRRFDKVYVDHVGGLWDRVAKGVNSFLRDVGHSISWQCEEIKIGFETLEEAPLVELLSEGDHPSEGNDALFLLINDIAGRYNGYVGRLVECVNSSNEASIQEYEVNPKFVATGCGGAVSMSAAMPLSPSALCMTIESCWNSSEQAFDLQRLDAALRREINLSTSLPLLANPTRYLRERFLFRDDRKEPVTNATTHVPVFASQDGEFFGNAQDFQLVDDVRQRLHSFDMVIGNGVRRTLNDNFYNFSYEQLRCMLEGCRSFLASMSIESTEFTSVGNALHTLVGGTGPLSDYKSVGETLQRFGFPDVSETQSQLLAALNEPEFVELVNYLAYQLASESYLFANLPLCMTDPLRESDRETINSNLVRLRREHGAGSVAHFIEEFTRDILTFYENQIRQESTLSNRSLKKFLIESNFCDDNSDPLFKILPTGVKLHNYISLRQYLHQQKLAFLCLSGDTKPETAPNTTRPDLDIETVALFKRPSRGRCWLWESEDEVDPEELLDEERVASSQHNERWALWFESLLSDKPKIVADVEMENAEAATDADPQAEHFSEMVEDEERMEVEEASMNVDGLDEKANGSEESAEDRCATVLQRWWRRQSSQDEFEQVDDYSDEEFDKMFGYEEDYGQETMKKIQDDASVDMYEDSNKARDEDSVAQNDESPTLDSQEDSDATMNDCGCDPNPPDELAHVVPTESMPSTVQLTYGSPAEETLMRQWLDENRLPQSVADELGAREVADLVSVVEEHEYLLADLMPLDRAKLKKAVKAYREAPK